MLIKCVLARNESNHQCDLSMHIVTFFLSGFNKIVLTAT